MRIPLFVLFVAIFVLGWKVNDSLFVVPPDEVKLQPQIIEPMEQQLDSWTTEPELELKPHNSLKGIITERPEADDSLYPPQMNGDFLSILFVEDVGDQTANLYFATLQPEAQTVYLSQAKGVPEEAGLSTQGFVTLIEHELNYPISYFVRLDREQLRTAEEQIKSNRILQSIAKSTWEEAVLEGDLQPNDWLKLVSSVDVSSFVQGVTKELSFKDLMALRTLAATITSQVETNITMKDLLVLRNELEYLQQDKGQIKIQDGFYYDDIISLESVYEQEKEAITTILSATPSGV